MAAAATLMMLRRRALLAPLAPARSARLGPNQLPTCGPAPLAARPSVRPADRCAAWAMRGLSSIADSEPSEGSTPEQGTRPRVSKRRMKKHGFELAPISVALVGRPNVGKSTFFNRLVRKKEAIVSSVPGTTRDRKEGKAQLGEIEFTLTDTGGFEDLIRGSKSPTELLAPEHGSDLVRAMHFQVRQAVEKADVVMLIVDAKEGISTADIELARWVRRHRNNAVSSLNSDLLEQAQAQIAEHTGLEEEFGKDGLILVANKAEGKGDAFDGDSDDHLWSLFMQECYSIGWGNPVPISAEHNHGLGDIHNALLPFAIAKASEFGASTFKDTMPKLRVPVDKEDRTALISPVITMAIIGRPNVGKSTMLNKIVGEERCIAGPVPGLTRDAVHIEWEYEGRNLRLVDTAGIRRRTKLFGGTSSAMARAASVGKGTNLSPIAVRKNDAKLEDLSIVNSLRALDRSQVVAVVIDAIAQDGDLDASGPLTRHDLSIISRVLDEGRGLVIVANKCDLADDDWETFYKSNLEEYIRYHLEESIPMAKGVPIVTTSALTNAGVSEVIPTVIDVFDRWRSRIPTAKLNAWLAEAQTLHPPPASRGAVYRKGRTASGPLRIKYATQASTRPPTFVLFVNRTNPKPDVIPEDYQRYLLNSLREKFGLAGLPLRISIRGNVGKKHRNA